MYMFKDKNGQSLSLGTSLANVNMEVTPPHELELAEWDRVKPDLGTMNQGISSVHTVVDPEAVVLSESFQPPAQVTPKETWMEKWDRTKPDLGTMELPHVVGGDSEPEEPGM